MRRLRVLRVPLGLAVAAVAVVLAASCTKGSAQHASGAQEAAAQGGASAQHAAPTQLSVADQAALQELINASNLPELRWPDFSDYRKHVQKFYGAYGMALPWVRDGQPTAQARQVIAILRDADEKGLNAEDYDASRWEARLSKLQVGTGGASAADAMRFDVELTACVMRYISDLHIGKVNPKHFAFGFDVETKKYDLPDFLKEHVVDDADVAGELAQVEPPYPGYQRTMKALHTYLALEKQQREPIVLPASAKPVTAGNTYPGTPQLAHLLQMFGDLPANVNIPADSTVYDGALVDAVKAFQRRHGRDPDGRLTAQTLADLNVPLSQRVRQIQWTLERWRWLPMAPHSAPIVANIPEFRVRAYDENFKIALSMNVVVGKAYRHTTPVFQDSMEYVIFRPYWSVPYSIEKAEILPKLAKDPDYLAKKNFEVVDSKQNVVAGGAVSDEVLQQLRAGKLFVREKPGPKNSLGLVKFIFPNSYDVYMHDTPEHALFADARRDFSHGCVRLERPADMAAWVLRNNPGWNADRIRAAMNGDATQQVNLAKPIPVLIVYGTVVAPEDGLVYFFDDIYGYDEALEKVLAKGYPYPG